MPDADYLKLVMSDDLLEHKVVGPYITPEPWLQVREFQRSSQADMVQQPIFDAAAANIGEVRNGNIEKEIKRLQMLLRYGIGKNVMKGGNVVDMISSAKQHYQDIRRLGERS